MKPVNPRDTSVHLIATVQAKPGKKTELLDALAALVDASIAEAGCLQYALHVEPERPGVFVFYEAWQNQAALDEHMASTHFQPFVAISGALIEGTTDIRKLTRTR